MSCFFSRACLGLCVCGCFSLSLLVPVHTMIVCNMCDLFVQINNLNQQQYLWCVH